MRSYAVPAFDRAKLNNESETRCYGSFKMYSGQGTRLVINAIRFHFVFDGDQTAFTEQNLPYVLLLQIKPERDFYDESLAAVQKFPFQQPNYQPLISHNYSTFTIPSLINVTKSGSNKVLNGIVCYELVRNEILVEKESGLPREMDYEIQLLNCDGLDLNKVLGTRDNTEFNLYPTIEIQYEIF